MPKRRRRRRGREIPLTEDQRRALIPGGPVNPHRAGRDTIDIEIRATSEKGSTLVTGERVSTPIRKLLQQDHITLEEASAAQLFLCDHDIAYASCINPLAAVLVDGSSGDGTGGLERRIHHGSRFKKARAWLRSEMARIAEAAILEAGLVSMPATPRSGPIFFHMRHDRSSALRARAVSSSSSASWRCFTGSAIRGGPEFCSRGKDRP